MGLDAFATWTKREIFLPPFERPPLETSTRCYNGVESAFDADQKNTFLFSRFGFENEPTPTLTDHETIYQSCFQKQHREECGFVSGDHRDHLHLGRRVGGRHRRRLRRRVRPKPILRRRLAGT